MYIFLIFFLIFLFDFIIVTINLIQLLAAILIRINYLSIYNQNAYVKGRTIFDAIRGIYDILEYTERLQLKNINSL